MKCDELYLSYDIDFAAMVWAYEHCCVPSENSGSALAELVRNEPSRSVKSPQRRARLQNEFCLISELTWVVKLRNVGGLGELYSVYAGIVK